MSPVLRRLTRDSEMAVSQWYLARPGFAVRPRYCGSPRPVLRLGCDARRSMEAEEGQSLSYVRPTRCSRKTAERRPGESSGDPLATRSHNQTYIFLPDAIGAIRGTFVEGRTGRQHEREEGAETVIRFSPLIAFPAGGPGSWFVHGRGRPRRRVFLCSRARGKEESVECPSCPSDSSQRAC